MFSSFFPNPRLFFPAALVWTALTMALWYAVARDLGPQLSLGGLVGFAYPPANADERPLRRALGPPAPHRGRLPARPGGHPEVRPDRRAARGEPGPGADDPDRLPADPVGAVGLREGAAAGRRGAAGAGVRRR